MDILVLFDGSLLNFDFMLLLDCCVNGFDVSSDGSVVIGCGNHETITGGRKNVVIAHGSAGLTTGAVFWRKEMLGNVWSLLIHGAVAVVPVDDSSTVVLDLATGHQIHALPAAGEIICGLCVFDGSTNCYAIFFVDFLNVIYH